MSQQSSNRGQPLNEEFVNSLLATLIDALPAGSDAAAGRRRDMARKLLDAMQPRDALEATLAVQAIGAHHALMDCFRAAMLPDTTHANAIRLRNCAVSLGRRFDLILRTLEQRHAQSDQAAAPKLPDRQPLTVPAASVPAATVPATSVPAARRQPNGAPSDAIIPSSRPSPGSVSIRENLAASVSHMATAAALASASRSAPQAQRHLAAPNIQA